MIPAHLSNVSAAHQDLQRFETRVLPTLTHVLPPIFDLSVLPSMSLAFPRLRSFAPPSSLYLYVARTLQLQLKLTRYPLSLVATLATLPSMSPIPLLHSHVASVN